MILLKRNIDFIKDEIEYNYELIKQICDLLTFLRSN